MEASTLRAPARARIGSRRTIAMLLAVAMAAALCFGVVARGSSSAQAATTGCPTTGLAFSSNLSNGVLKIGNSASSTGNSGTACGSIGAGADGGLMATIPMASVKFNPSTVKVTFLSLPTTVTATSDLTGAVTIDAAGQHATLAGSVVATSNILGFKCSIPLNLALTTEKSGSMAGTPFVDDGTGVLKGKLVANAFTVSKISSSKTCPALIAAVTNLLLGTPLAAGKSSVVFDATLKLGL